MRFNMFLGRTVAKDRSTKDWVWLTLGLCCLVFALWRSLVREKSYGDMLDQYHWSQLSQGTLHDKQMTTLAGYMLPLPNQDGERTVVTKFILVPYLPSCTQRPPPLSNQTVIVEIDPIRFSNDPVIVRGEITKLTNAESGAGFRMQARGLRPWSRGQFAQTDDE